MILLIDMGNSYLKIAFFDPAIAINAQVWQSKRFQLPSYKSQTTNNWEAWLEIQINLADAVVFSNVAEQSYEVTLLQIIKEQNKIYYKVTTQLKAFDVINGYQKPLQLGVDRWLTLVATRQRYQEPLLIIDIGTAITLDLLDEQGVHLGGWIAPGYQLMTQAIFDYAAQIKPQKETSSAEYPTNQFNEHANVEFGQDTHIGLHNGCVAALVGFIDHGLAQAQQLLILRASQKKTQQKPKLILLGGGIRHLPISILEQATINQNLIFEGLAWYATEFLNTKDS